MEDEKSKILGQKLDDDELDQISGGTHKSANKECPNAGIVGGCSGAFYQEACHATVEAGSKCWSNDFLWTDYTVTQEATDKYGVTDHPNRCTWAYHGAFRND